MCGGEVREVERNRFRRGGQRRPGRIGTPFRKVLPVGCIGTNRIRGLGFGKKPLSLFGCSGIGDSSESLLGIRGANEYGARS